MFMTVSLMDPLHIILPFLCGAVSCSFDWTSASVSEVTVRHGDNITLHCDVKMEHRRLTVWFKKCSHENQSVLVLNGKYIFQNLGKTRLIWTENDFTYDLTIINVTYSDEGFYYCGAEITKVEDKEYINQNKWYNYSNIIRKISIKSNGSHHCSSDCQQNYNVCSKLPFFLCPVVSLLSVLLSVLVYRICQKSGFLPTSAANASQNSEKTQNSREPTRLTQLQGEDVCYAALEIQHSSLKTKKRTTQTSDFSIYSDIKSTQL